MSASIPIKEITSKIRFSEHQKSHNDAAEEAKPADETEQTETPQSTNS